ncbi:hypothetical protein NUM3379_16560 [Kineococcus sp. NUM-3379]
MTEVSAAVTCLRQLPQWNEAISRLGELYALQHGKIAEKVTGYGDRYRGARAAMVVDVVMSRQRAYTTRVLPRVEKFRQTQAAASLTLLARLGPGELGWVRGEADTVQAVAEGLCKYSKERGLDDDEGTFRWATDQEPIRYAWRLDPYVGQVKGIGIALFAYLRMRSGVDALKPDVRVRKALNKLGFAVPVGDAALILVAEAAAEELGLKRLELDQLLW